MISHRTAKIQFLLGATTLLAFACSAVSGAAVPNGDTSNRTARALEKVRGADASSRTTIASLISSLGGATWQKRQLSQRGLVELASEHWLPVQQQCLRAISRSDDPEIRLRATEVLRAVVLTKHFREQRGFVGVRLTTSASTVKLGNNHVRPIQIVTVLPATAASTNGLRAADMILQVDNLSGAKLGVRQFVTYIAGKSPGDKVKLVIQSNGRQITKEIALGARPILPEDRPVEVRRREFFDHWLKEALKKAKQRADKESAKARPKR